MKIIPLPLEGLKLIQLEPYKDARGSFELGWESDLFSKAQISFFPDSSCFSFNKTMGTLRGFHFQSHPHGQTKLVKCVAGSICDIVIDLRPESPTYLQSEQLTLHAETGDCLLIPAEFAHGFQTLQPDTLVHYLISGAYQPDHARVIRWDDPVVGASWPIPHPILSLRDRTAPFLPR